MIGPSEAKELFPLIEQKELLGAAFIPSDGHVDPASLCQAIATVARNQGAEIRQGVKVVDFKKQGRRIVEVVTTGGNYKAENIILATGMWSRELGQRLGIEFRHVLSSINISLLNQRG